MAGLRDLLEYSQAGLTIPNPPVRVVRVYDTALTTANNGGFACTWTVPSDVAWVGVEMWGGGGSGAGGCCNFTGTPGGAGTYVRRILGVSPGQEYIICAAGTTNYTNSCDGIAGFPSYMCRDGEFCISAGGGVAGQTRCGFAYAGVVCKINTCQVGTSQNATLTFKGLCSWARSTAMRCYFTQIVTGSPYAHPNPRFSRNVCATCCGQGVIGCTVFPGTGGMSAQHSSCVACHCGAIGAGGLVQLYYYSATTP